MTNPNTPIVNAGVKYVNGLSIAQAGSNLLQIDIGAARDSLNENDIVSSTSLFLNMNRIGINGLDSGTLLASRYYAVFLIGDSTKNNPTASLASLSMSNPILPSGYDIFRRIGWAPTNSGGVNARMIQTGEGTYRKYITDDESPTLITAGTATNFGAGLINLALINFPPIETDLIVGVTYTPALAANVLEFGPLGGSLPSVRFGCGVAAVQVGVLNIPSGPSASSVTARYRVQAGDTVTIVLNGFTDPLL